MPASGGLNLLLLLLEGSKDGGGRGGWPDARTFLGASFLSGGSKSSADACAESNAAGGRGGRPVARTYGISAVLTCLCRRPRLHSYLGYALPAPEVLGSEISCRTRRMSASPTTATGAVASSSLAAFAQQLAAELASEREVMPAHRAS